LFYTDEKYGISCVGMGYNTLNESGFVNSNWWIESINTTMHILLICSTYPEQNNARKGVFFRDQAQALRSAGHQVGVIVANGINPKDFLLMRNADPVISFDGDIPVYRSVRLPIPIRNNDSMLHLWSMTTPVVWLFNKYVKNYGYPDILHAQNFFYGGLAGILLKKKTKLPLILTEHSSEFLREALSEKRKNLFRENIGFIDQCLAVSKALSNKLVGLNLDLNVKVIGNVIDIYFFKPNLYKDKKDFIFLIAARLDKNKRVDDAIRAFADAFRTKKNTQLWICGQGPEEEEMKNLAGDLDISGQTKFLGSISRDELRDYYSQADVVISTSQRETFGLSLLEAMACGRPVIATRSGGPEDFVNPMVGMLVDVGDIDALSKAMMVIHSYKEEFDSKVIREYAVRHYSREVIVGQLVKIYKDVMSYSKN